MPFADKHYEVRDYKVNKDYGDEEPFFRLITESGEVQLPKLQFQLGQPLPDTLSCRVKGAGTHMPVIGHNMPRYVSEFYADGFSRGEEYEFRVIGLPEDAMGDYRLCDENGLLFKLHEPKNILVKGQSVKCKFVALDQNVFIIKRSNSDALLPMLTLRDFARIAMVYGVNAVKIEQVMRNIPEFEPALDELNHGRSVWVLTAMRALKGAMTRLFCEAVDKYSPEIINDAMGGYRNILLYLLQGSGYLKNIRGNERIELQQEMTWQLEQLDNYARTLQIITSRSEKKFISELLTNLKESGYIYHPNTQFAIMMILFRIDPRLVNDSLGPIFDALMGWDPETWKNEPFRQAFVDQLEIYIRDTSQQINRFLQAQTPQDNEMIEKVLTSIAIQQSLALPTDNIDLRLNMSLFYRYLSMLRTSKADVLIDKSYLALMGVKLPTDFTWSDIKETTMMMTRAAVDPPVNAVVTASPRYYLNGDIEVEIGADGISIVKITDDAGNQVPNNMLPWPGCKVNVSIDRGLNHTRAKTLDGHAEFWNSIEKALYMPDSVPVEQVTTRLEPDVGDVVRIIIDKVIPSANDYHRIEAFHCKVVDEHYTEREGYLNADDLVNYNLHDVTVGTFRFDNGDYMRFDATVKDIDDNDNLMFSLQDATRSAIRDIANVNETCLCVVTRDNGRSYSAISEKGFGLYINKDADEGAPYHRGNVLKVVITGYDNDSIQSVVEDGPYDNYFFSNARALHNLLLAIAIDESGDEGDEMELDDSERFSREDLLEVIDILRYKAVASSSDILTAFDYLSYARLLALAANEEKTAATLKAHKDILLQHQNYAKNKQIFIDDVEAILASASDSELIRRMAERLLIVAALDHPEDNNRLWYLAQNADNDADKELAKTVLSYNLLYELNREDKMLSTLKDKVARMLNVSSDQRNLKYYGSESQYVEFKSSLVYPAQKGKSGISMADPDKQEYEILHIIAGFMNTTGGTLYIGVNDDHYERGLDEDFTYYKNDRGNKYRHAIKSLDNMANYLQNLIDSAYNLGKNAGDYAVAYIDDESTKGVIGVKVEPCPHIVKLNDTIYVRHSAKTTPLVKKEEISLFEADRNRLFNTKSKSTVAGGSDIVATAQASNADAVETTPVAPDNAMAEVGTESESVFSVSTSAVRYNILHEWQDTDHFVTPLFYIRFVGDSEYVITTDEWSIDESDRLVLAITDEEADDYLLLVYEGDYAIKVRMRELYEKGTNSALPHYADRRLVYASPVKAAGGLYTLHTNNKGTLYERLTPLDKIPQGLMTTLPERIMEAEGHNTEYHECVSPDKMSVFAAINSTTMKRTQIGALAKGANVARTTADEIKKIVNNKLQNN